MPRKVYRYQKGRRKKRMSKVAYASGILLIGAVLVFLGYSIAGPLFAFFSGEKATETEILTTPTFTLDTTSVTKIREDTASETGGTAIETHSPFLAAYSVPPSALDTLQSLSDYILEAQNNGFNAVSIPLRIEGGFLTYKSDNETAINAELVRGTLTARQIADTIKSAGLRAVAEMNLLHDTTFYPNYKMSYKFDGSGERWLDNALNKGGRPWISPFDPDTITYLSDLSAEVSGAGFEEIVFDGLLFPPFRSTDLNYIGDKVKSAERYKALIDVYKAVSGKAAENKAAPKLEIRAIDLINNTAEAYKPAELDGAPIVVEYNAADFTKTIIADGTEIILADMDEAGKVSVVMQLCAHKLSGTEGVTIKLVGISPFTESYSSVTAVLASMGFNDYII
ncbi:MAG: putative glycoside hydrolase [Ruminococcus sp.]|jgi:hypothetical protein|nr:putative glycoside hydrolase [Ruminococcus sp.]